LLTLNGYLGGKYAIDDPLSLSATISFEQLYDGIEGDSASSTELYALLSSLSGLPLRQGIAVTGSVDQQGNVQPVGGVNEKVEGFFETCRQRGLTGDQGVILPRQNVANLMLRKDVRQAVEESKFRIYAVETIDEGIEILTGVAAGEIGDDGEYAADSVHGRVMARLREIARNLKPKDEDEGDQDSPEDVSSDSSEGLSEDDSGETPDNN
jgi:predicted ATP-dependent protease